ncbi:MAG: DsrH/TusB family sulfur metabolism protein [Candidatus Thorarchaeota archaeon]
MKFLLWLSNRCTSLVETVSALKSGGHEIGVLLLQDGVFMADKGCPDSKPIEGLAVYANKKNVDERGLSNRLISGVKLVEYPEIVELMMEIYDRVISI